MASQQDIELGEQMKNGEISADASRGIIYSKMLDMSDDLNGTIVRVDKLEKRPLPLLYYAQANPLKFISVVVAIVTAILVLGGLFPSIIP